MKCVRDENKKSRVYTICSSVHNTHFMYANGCAKNVHKYMELNLVLLNFVIMKSSISFDLPTYYKNSQ